MSFTTLIDTAALESRLQDAAVAVVDCRFKLDDPDWGAREYGSGHIPGAVYASLDRDLSGEKTGRNGRHPLPDASVFARTVGSLGIDRATQVVAYDQDSGMYASRLWWMLRWMGHTAVAVLDGGYAQWTREGRPVRPGPQTRPARHFAAAPRADLAVTADQVASMIGSPGWVLMDARSPERFRGEQETIDKAAGHIPGAANHFFKKNVSDAGTFRPAEMLRKDFAGVIGSPSAERVVCYCGSGVTACHNILALEHAGLHGARLYPGSWSEWSSDASRPVE